jgi:hypothetical protein
MNGISLSNNDMVLFAEKHYEMKIFLFSSIHKIEINEFHTKRTMNKDVSIIHNIDFFVAKL